MEVNVYIDIVKVDPATNSTTIRIRAAKGDEFVPVANQISFSITLREGDTMAVAVPPAVFGDGVIQ